MKDKKKLIVLIVMLLLAVAGIWYFIKMSLKYMKGAEIEIFFPNNFFKQFGVWSIIWIILWIVIMFIERKYKVKKIKERKNSIKIKITKLIEEKNNRPTLNLEQLRNMIKELSNIDSWSKDIIDDVIYSVEVDNENNIFINYRYNIFEMV